MLKSRGFTIIEILTTITILAIVASIAAPEFWKMKNRDDYKSEGQALFDTLLDARNAALTNRFCSDGSISVRWTVYIDSNDSPMDYRLFCYRNETNYSVEQTIVGLDQSELETVYIDNVALAAIPDNVRISFYSGGVAGKLEYTPIAGALTKSDSIQMIIGHASTDYQHTICFNRVSGFPTFNKTGNTCQTY